LQANESFSCEEINGVDFSSLESFVDHDLIREKQKMLSEMNYISDPSQNILIKLLENISFEELERIPEI
jgi:hypothetical protein